jgi:hypothetical protein
MVVTRYDAYRSDIAGDLCTGLPLHDAHEDKEGDRVHHGTSGDAVNEPLGQRIAQAELGLSSRLSWRRRRWCLPSLHRLQLGVLFASTTSHRRVGGERLFEELLPVVIGRRSREREEDESKQLCEIESERFLSHAC